MVSQSWAFVFDFNTEVNSPLIANLAGNQYRALSGDARPPSNILVGRE